MRLIDADVLTEEFWKPEYRTQTRRDFISVINKFPTIDPVHFAGGCYCKECQYYEPFRDYPDCSKTLPYGYCYYWEYEEGESPNKVDENDFCSKGVIKSVKTY